MSAYLTQNANGKGESHDSDAFVKAFDTGTKTAIPFTMLLLSIDEGSKNG